MPKKTLILAALMVVFESNTGLANAQELLTGDTRLACEAILCLATGNRPRECTPSLHRYFSISHRRLSDTIRGRTHFLRLCPSSNQTPEMQTLLSAQANGAGRCDAQSLNITLMMSRGEPDGATSISSHMPGYCVAYSGHTLTNFNDMMPRYVGTPERGGLWVAAQDYQNALAQYNERIQREDEEQERSRHSLNQSWIN